MTIDIISIRDCIDLEIDPNEFVFVLAPFGPKRTAIYNNIIKPVVEDKGFICKRADDFKTNTNKINDIIRKIWKCQFIIADLTGLNANVMYELGFSHAMNKQVIMISEEKYKKNRFPFDIGYIQIIKYKSDPTGGITLKRDLEDTIDYVIGTITTSSNSDITKLFIEKENTEFNHSIISKGCSFIQSRT